MTAEAQDLHLILFFTRGVSLRTWDQVGILEREVALYRALRPHLGGVTFVTYGDARDLDYAARLPGIRIICNRWGLPQSWYVRLLTRLYPLLWRGPAVYKSNQVQGADIALKAARRFGKRSIVRCGYLYSDFMEREHGKGSSQARQARRLERQIFTTADRVVVTTPAMRRAVMDGYGIPARQIVVIPNYVETDRFRPRFGERSDREVIFVGRLALQKNVGALLEAVEPLDVCLTLIGDGELSSSLQQRFGSLNGRVRWLGAVPNVDLPAYLNRAGLFVLPSHYEGHPKALIEAMSCGLPVIGADVPGIRELIRHGETGWLCGTDPVSIRAAIQELLDRPQLRARLGDNARQFVVEHFALERVVEMELGLLRQVAGE